MMSWKKVFNKHKLLATLVEFASRSSNLFQFGIAALLWLPTLSGGLNIMSYTFAGYVPKHRCSLPCETNETRNNPSLDWFENVPKNDDLHSDCNFYQFKGDSSNSEGCRIDMFDTSKVVPCESFVYDRKHERGSLYKLQQCT